MNFEPTEERRMIADSLRRYLADTYGTEIRNGILASEQGWSAEVWTGLAELGVIGALFPEDQGGFGGAGFDIATVFEELGRAGVVEPVLETAVLGGRLVDDPDVVEGVIGGSVQLAFAHGEPGSRYDLDRIATRAADGKLTGRKSVVGNAEAADWLIVSAQEGEGLSLWRVAPGDVLIRGYAMNGGGRAAEVVLEDAPGARIGEAGDALQRIEAAVAAAHVALAAEALGAMQKAVELTTGYLEQRKQFGKPIGTFQALQHRLAEMLIELEQARSMVILAAAHLDDAPPERDRHLAAARNLIGRVARLIAEESIQMHGGIAMTQEYELAHIAKRLVMTDHRWGDTDHHLERFIELSA